MDKLDGLVASHLEDRLLQPERLETIQATVLDRRQERSERQREHIAELNRRAAESEARLKRLYDAIEAGVADLDDPALKDRIDGLKAIRDQAKADAERSQAMLQNSGSKAVTPQMLSKFARTARQRIRLEGGGYRRDHLPRVRPTRRGRRRRGSYHGIEVSAAPDACGERRRKRSAHSGTEVAEREGLLGFCGTLALRAALRAFDSGFARIVDPGFDCSRVRIPDCAARLKRRVSGDCIWRRERDYSGSAEPSPFGPRCARSIRALPESSTQASIVTHGMVRGKAGRSRTKRDEVGSAEETTS
ncbi:hypothetical protein RM530_03770 [Algiphilus sp. W345]|uniref:Uncharacterized protein n=1 Tax=Banduia mediterranea TaxID=3075609 RepID=A0ABU2WG42_9GAMM|nr:hypothetical protein [Algiphilus sp. W345]MDT0496483.1 hypothetical protein [Algiphilus sp. W345]